MVGDFLHYFPQYTLDDLRRMSVVEFYFLNAARIDTVDPETTDPFAELVQKRLIKMTQRGPGRR